MNYLMRKGNDDSRSISLKYSPLCGIKVYRQGTAIMRGVSTHPALRKESIFN